MAEEKQMTEEEMKKFAEEKQAEWNKMKEDLKADPDKQVTNEDLLKVIEFSENMMQMIGINGQNIHAVHHNFQQLVQMLQGGGGQDPVAGKTPGGIILP